ncbi:deoxynucleotide monophosphate kinase [Ancylobacter polymorphus]|uniref:Deoxynucleotide monophosphate kinase n=1 Tax=Ancylobacter polymorphus TaxID=223390 RepID=A0A9E7A216_9HYPH|nr:deoxynucleotide monophosphate kinase [Ancylobacter polymorphus]UOK71740.1 deoxynucleotide monophosphate kinase [Ancylobacter polymorphus]
MGIAEDFYAAVGDKDAPGFVVPPGMRLTVNASPPANDNRPQPRRLPPVVAFSAPAGGGKSTAARHLVTMHGYTLVKFAGPLKDMCRAIGMTESQIEGEHKELPSRMLQGKSPRQFMQLLGTEFGRDLIGPGLWSSLWQHRALQAIDQGGRVVCDDMRFANEEAGVRQLGGIVVRLEGRGGIAGGHASEAYRPRASATVWNGEGADLAAGLDVMLEAWGDMQEAA